MRVACFSNTGDRGTSCDGAVMKWNKKNQVRAVGVNVEGAHRERICYNARCAPCFVVKSGEILRYGCVFFRRTA